MISETIRVKNLMQNIYEEHGRPKYEGKGNKNDPNSKNTLETLAYRKAYRALGSQDRVVIDGAVKRFSEVTHLGTDAALGTLMRLGIWLAEVKK